MARRLHDTLSEIMLSGNERHCQLNGPWSCLGWELGPWRDYAAFWAHVSLVQILKARPRAAR